MSRPGRNARVVDTNVVVVSNRRNGESRECANHCAQALLKITKLGLLVLDNQGLILTEYRRYCSFSGQPGIGDYFFRWVHDNLGQAHFVQRVAIANHPDAPHSFVEFPEHEELTTFDPADRKFVAVSNAHQDKPMILQASDSKWWGVKDALLECGITVDFLCRSEIEEVHRRKTGR